MPKKYKSQTMYNIGADSNGEIAYNSYDREKHTSEIDPWAYAQETEKGDVEMIENTVKNTKWAQ